MIALECVTRESVVFLGFFSRFLAAHRLSAVLTLANFRFFFVVFNPLLFWGLVLAEAHGLLLIGSRINYFLISANGTSSSLRLTNRLSWRTFCQPKAMANTVVGARITQANVFAKDQ